MTGKYDVIVKNARVQYKFTINRNITILKGDSATGKTTLIDMIAAYQQNGENSGVTVICKKSCVVLTSPNWKIILENIHDSIVFIDEGDAFIKSKEFSEQIQKTDNYYVISTRVDLATLPYSVNEIYGIKNKAGNRYQQTKRLFSEFYPLNNININSISKPDLVIVEDSNSGFEFFSDVCTKYGIRCISANGKSNIFKELNSHNTDTVLVIADGAAFGSEIDRILNLKKNQNIILYCPESFEWLILKSGLINGVSHIIDSPNDYIESLNFFSWEQFFSNLLISTTNNTYLKYKKSRLNSVYLQKNEQEAILSVMPEMNWD